MESGKTRRLRRIFRSTGRTVVIPMDHGVSVGPIDGLTDMSETVAQIRTGGADAVLVHAGIAKSVDTYGLGLILHLSGATRMTTEPNWKSQVSTVQQAVHLGADAVSVHINVGSEHEKDMVERFSRIVDDCDKYGLPTLAMMYPRGPNIRSETDPEMVAHAARLGYEIGADIVKTNFTGQTETFRRVVEAVKVPVLVAGGPKTGSDNDLLRVVQDSMQAGAAGVSIGRYVFQHSDPAAMTRAIVKIVHGGAPTASATSTLGGRDETILARA
jgi:fructose-bisphosphate aldolase / 2-amino-3,7-dideoxy-D-threo-hept-6-ulosonate synthase